MAGLMSGFDAASRPGSLTTQPPTLAKPPASPALFPAAQPPQALDRQGTPGQGAPAQLQVNLGAGGPVSALPANAMTTQPVTAPRSLGADPTQLDAYRNSVAGNLAVNGHPADSFATQPFSEAAQLPAPTMAPHQLQPAQPEMPQAPQPVQAPPTQPQPPVSAQPQPVMPTVLHPPHQRLGAPGVVNRMGGTQSYRNGPTIGAPRTVGRF